LAGVVGAYFGRSPWTGALCGMAAGVALAVLFAFVTVTRGADQVVAGTALNLLALGATGAAFRAITGQMTTPLIAPAFPEIALPGLARLPVLGAAFFDRNALTY